MLIYIYRNYVSDDEEIMQEKIQELIGMEHHSVSTVEALAENEWANVDEEQCSCKGLFDLMRQGYIFLAHCGVE